MENFKKCKNCGKRIRGRTDKIYCDRKCKDRAYFLINEKIVKSTESIDKILHRNYKILSDEMEGGPSKKKIPILKLSLKKFNFNYITNFRTNTAGKVYHYVYDLAWMTFSDNEILIVRQNNRN